MNTNANTYASANSSAATPRNLIVCCDGTNNTFGPENTNVVRLVQSIDRNPARQLVYYDPGVGTLPEPGLFTRIGKRTSEIFGLAFGTGLTDKVSRAYEYLMGTYRPGDQVFLFGFSRGAYSVRVLAAMLHIFGLLPVGNTNLVPYVMRLFKGSRNLDKAEFEEHMNLCDEFRETFAREIPGQPDRRFRVHFVGVWDTVSSVGWVWEPVSFPFTAFNPSVACVRHAVAIDERRSFFRQNLFNPTVPGQDLVEQWFAGVHSDIGGGYPASAGGLWRVAFDWMVDEAVSRGLQVDTARLSAVRAAVSTPDTWAEPINNSLTPAWWPAEIFPKLRPSSPFPRFNLGRPRTIHDGAKLHPAALRRLQSEPSYHPHNVPKTPLPA